MASKPPHAVPVRSILTFPNHSIYTHTSLQIHSKTSFFHIILTTMFNLTTKFPFFLLLPILSVFLIFSAPHFIKITTKSPETHLHIQKHLQVAHSTCQGTLYPELCVSTLSSFPGLAAKSLPQIISSVVNHTVKEVKSSSYNCSSLRKKLSRSLDPLDRRALDDCLNLFEDTVAELRATVADLSRTQIGSKRYHDLQTLMSGAMTNMYTCLDGFAYSRGNVRKRIEKELHRISSHVSNSLAMLKKVPGVKTSSPLTESEVFPEYGKMKDGFPSWLGRKERRLLQASVNETKFDLVVAKDGSGNFSTINEAVAAAPNSSATRHVIFLSLFYNLYEL